MGYSRLAIKSISWVSAFRIVYRGIAFIRTAILARILSPLHFGQFGIAALLLALVEMLTETGINVFLVQQDDEHALETYLNTAWVISIIRGCIISLTVAATSFIVADFFNSPESFQLLLWMALVPLIRGFINPAIAKFQKQLQFDKEFLVRSTITFVDATVAIGFAIVITHPVSLVFGLIAGAITEVILSLVLIKPQPKPVYTPIHARKIIHSGKWITTAGIASYLATKSIDTSIGKLLSTQALGFYQMAYKVSVLFIDELVELVNRVAFPVYAKIQGDQERLRKAFFKTAGIYTLLGLLMLGGIYVTSPLIVALFLGDQWVAVIPVIRELTVVGLAIVLTTPTNPLFLAARKQNYLTAAVVNQLIVVLGGLFFVIPNPSLSSIISLAALSMFATLPLRSYCAYLILWKPRNNLNHPRMDPHSIATSAPIMTTTYQGTNDSL